MSIRVEGISKRYGEQLAVNNVSFEVGTGQIVGFIGPNGAGKSTTMKIITGTVRPDSGLVKIKDIPVFENLKETRRIIGYLPEHNPLYLDMYIREYLEYVSNLYSSRFSVLSSQGGTGSQSSVLSSSVSGQGRRSSAERKLRVKKVIEITGLGPEMGKTIAQLSKGYRQRVGLAQALVHDPEILILDEPTTGLDPNQLSEIRKLISDIGREKTILLSTHILQEVEAICDRVIIINQGRIVADDSSALLREASGMKKQTIRVELDRDIDPEIWMQVKGITAVRSLKSHIYLLESSEIKDIRANVFNFAVNQNLTILSLSMEEKSLEQVFRDMTRS